MLTAVVEPWSPTFREVERPLPSATSETVEHSTDLSPTRIRDVSSAITCFCGLIGQEPGGVPLDLVAIGAKLNAINPVANGISPKRLANIRSDLFAAITASKLKPVTPRRQSLTEPWRSLRWLKAERHRIGISRLSHYASTTALTPTDVDDEVIQTSSPPSVRSPSIASPTIFIERRR